jgi:hypothetical protein
MRHYFTYNLCIRHGFCLPSVIGISEGHQGIYSWIKLLHIHKVVEFIFANRSIRNVLYIVPKSRIPSEQKLIDTIHSYLIYGKLLIVGQRRCKLNFIRF